MHELVIQMYPGPDGRPQIKLRGPLGERGLCYMMLELARDQIGFASHLRPAPQTLGIAPIFWKDEPQQDSAPAILPLIR